jgi:hypothetical protein
VLLDARERAAVNESFEFWPMRDRDRGWLVHCKEARQ